MVELSFFLIVSHLGLSFLEMINNLLKINSVQMWRNNVLSCILIKCMLKLEIANFLLQMLEDLSTKPIIYLFSLEKSSQIKLCITNL